jgi:flagellar motor switch protein FliG
MPPPAAAAAPDAAIPDLAIDGGQKAAILILALGDTLGGKILALLREDEIRTVSKAMVRLGPIPARLVEQLSAEVVAGVGNATGLTGGLENTERFLLKSLPPERVARIMEEIQGPSGRSMWDKLGHVDEGVLASYLKNEYPQTVAVVISKLPPEHAAKVLAELPEAYATEVVMRLLRLETVRPDVLDGIERTLRAEFMSNLARASRRDPHERMATIFNTLDRKTEARFLGALERRDQAAADRIRALMFTFEDLVRVPTQGIQVLLRGARKDRIAMALKGASAELRDLFFRNLSERAGKMLREEIDGLGPVKMKEVDEARADIVRVAKELAAAGKIEIKASKDEEVVY